MTRNSATARERIEHIRTLLPEIGDISDETLRNAVEQIWDQVWVEGTWETLEEIPKNPSAPAAKVYVENAWTLITHTRTVAQLAVASADVLKSLHGLEYDRDALLALALLHDASKVIEYEGTPDSISKGMLGRRIQHGVYGAFLMWQQGLSADLVHGVISHTPSSGVLPQTHEALIVRYVDFLDTDAMLLDNGEKLHIS
jgi:hypothetical protein